MKNRVLPALLLSAFFGLFIGSAMGSAKADEKPLTKSDVEAIVKKVIHDNPELLVNSLKQYQAQQQAQALSKAAQNIVGMQGDLKNNPNSPSVGNPQGDVAVVEFFDYHCHYCKQFYPTLARLIEDDKNVKVVFKEFPILSEDSELAARAALAVYSIDKTKYFDYHTALMKSSGTFTMDMLSEKAKDLGIDADTFKKAMDNPDIAKELSHNKELARSLNIDATPTVIVDTAVMPGAVDLDLLKAKVALARKGAAEKKS